MEAERIKRIVRDAARLQPGRPALSIGMRAAAAVAAPLALAATLADQLGPGFVTWATLGGFGVVLVDKGGAYRTRALAMTAAALGGAGAALVGTAAAGSAAVLPLIALGTAACAFAAAWPPPAVSVGNTIAVQLIVASLLPASASRPASAALGFLTGAAWTILLALLLWPVRVYRPARQAAARCLREIATHARAIAARDASDPAAWRDEVTRRHRTMRETLEAARGVLAATRRGRRGELARGERLLVIVEALDQILGVMIGLEDVIDQLGASAHAAIGDAVAGELRAAATRLDELADRVVVETALPALPAPLAPLAPATSADPEAAHALALITRIRDDVAAVSAVVSSLATDREESPLAPSPSEPPAPWTDALRAALDRDSAVLRHAIRVGSVALASVIVTRALDLSRGYWATLTAALLLQPYLPATLTRGVQRVGGTILGGIIATAIAATIHDPLGIAIVAVGFAGVCAAVLQLNYGLYALFLTPTFVLLAEVNARDAHLVELRIANTLLGAALASAGALLLWPSREAPRARERLADALAAAADYVHEVFAVVVAGTPARSPGVIAARRRMGRAFNNAELSLDRLVAEGSAAIEPQMTLVTMARRLATTVSAFGTARHLTDTSAAAPAIARIGDDAERYLRDAADALRADVSPRAYARHDADAAALPPLLAARIARVDLQLSIVADAVARSANPIRV